MPQQRGFDGHRIRPAHVMRAVLADDKERLSELGRRGAAKRQRLRITEKARQNRAELEETQLAAENAARTKEDDARYFEELHRECNYHICPVD
jgi:hypothetical protein